MALTKAERQEIENLRLARDLALALRFPEEPEPVPVSEAEIKAEANESAGHRDKVFWGYSFNSHRAMTGYGHEIERTWSNGFLNGSSPSSGSRGCGVIYRTWDDARLALRHDLARKMATIMHRANTLTERGSGE